MAQILETKVNSLRPGELQLLFSQRFGLRDSGPMVSHYLDFRVDAAGLQILLEYLQGALRDLQAGVVQYEFTDIEIPFALGALDELQPI